MAKAAGKGKRKKAVTKAKAKPARKLRATKKATKRSASNKQSAKPEKLEDGRRRHRNRDLTIGQLQARAKIDPSSLTVPQLKQLRELQQLSGGKKGEGECVSINRAAELLGRSRRTVENLRDERRILPAAKGRINVESMFRYLRELCDAANVASGAVVAEPGSLLHWQTECSRLRAMLMEITEKEKTDGLTDTKRISDDLRIVGRRLLELLNAVGRQHGPDVATDIADGIELIQKDFGVS